MQGVYRQTTGRSNQKPAYLLKEFLLQEELFARIITIIMQHRGRSSSSEEDILYERKRTT
jgi:hypothetical protein